MADVEKERVQGRTTKPEKYSKNASEARQMLSGNTASISHKSLELKFHRN
jgi:hypothetical protein